MMTNNSKYGEVVINGVLVTLTQQAYPDGTNDAPRYRAHAVDGEGNDYRVEWQTTAAWDAQQEAYRNGTLDADDALIDEEYACDWDTYTVERR